MKRFGFLPFLLIFAIIHTNVSSQTKTEVQILKKAALQRADEDQVTFKKLLKFSKEKGLKLMTKGKNGRVIKLIGIDPLGYPIYVSTDNNTTSAATIRTNLLWPGGSTGFNLNGSSANMKGKLGIWDEGAIRATHVEIANRITQKDASATQTLGDHATHVAGTMIALGVNPAAKGMSFGAQELIAYDFSRFIATMFIEAPNLLVSNHSYGTPSGWVFNDKENRWDFYGQENANEDYKFGYYNSDAQLWDSIAYNAPNYLIVKSAGNDRNQNGPAIGQPYWRFSTSLGWHNAGNRPAGISDNNGYDNIPTYGTSKNILSVGAINPIPSGYNILSDAVLAPFSSWGPTDDGRIKPDVVTDGVGVLSSISTGDNAYATYNGTSMAAPAASGSLFLLQEYYSKLNSGSFMRSATLKGIIIHTADDGGNAGPDYQFGWGVVNMEKAAKVITTNNTSKSIYENVLANGATYTLPVIASGTGPLVVTICWTDPKGVVDEVNLLNNPAKKLVNDLDIRVKHGASTTYQPFVLNPAIPSALATTGDNITDNVEKIIIDDAVPGDTYSITVTHKGKLSRGSQAYSLLISGAGGIAYCASAPTSNTGARIDKVTVGSFSLTNVTGCTTYTNNTTSTIPIESGQSVPISINISSCDATSASKIVKVFIDYNNDGDFNDAGETVAQSGAIAGTNTFSGNFTTPSTLTTGTYILMRVIVQQTATAADINPCGSYANGETQDFRIKIASPSNDIGVTEIVSPQTSSCANANQYVSVRIKNFGAADKVNIPVTLEVKNGATVVATSSVICADTIHGNSDVVYTFQTPFAAAASTAYTITATASFTGDQNAQNNTTVTTLSVSGGTAAPAGTAAICGTSLVYLNATNVGSNLPVWYGSSTSTVPIAAGSNTYSTVITSDRTYYLATNPSGIKVGPANRTSFPIGNYAALNNNFLKFTNSVPLNLESVRLYVGKAGKINFILANLISSNAAIGENTYSILSSTTIDVYATGNGATDNGAVFYLNIPVATTGSHVLLMQFLNGVTLYYNSGITTNPYPFVVPNIISVTGNSQTNRTDTTDINYFQRFYLSLYDLEVKLTGCASPRVAVVATNAVAPVITQNSNVFTSSIATGNQWYLNGVAIAGATNQTYTAVSAGIYKTIVSGGCASNELNYGTTPVIDLNGVGIALVASPNPNKGQFFLQFEVKGKDDLIISLLNSLGQQVYTSKTSGFTGKFSQQVNTGQSRPGMYILKIQHNKKIILRRL